MVSTTERWLELLVVGEGRIRVEASVHSRVIAHWAGRYEGGWGSRVL